MESKAVLQAIERYRHKGFDCLCGNLRLATRVVTAAYDARLVASGLTSAQLGVIWCVLSAERASMLRIGELLVMEKSTVTRNVAVLRARGFVEVETGADARVKEVIATPAGRKAFARAIPHWQVAQREMSALLGSSRFRALVSETRHLATRSKKRAA
jgi:DNA-binding MarR family transcriptional regulator